MPEHICQNPECAREFTPSRNSTGKYCSLSCAARSRSRAKAANSHRNSEKVAHKIEMMCDNCRRTFSEYAAKRPRPLKFCARQCGFEYARKTKGFRAVPSADVDMARPKPIEPNMTVIYDPVKKELRNV